MTHAREPVGNARALRGDLLEDSGPSVSGDVLVTLHFGDARKETALF
jgi:hypothetical protein